MTEKGKYSVFLTLIGIPFSFVVSLVVIYVATFGYQMPFELQLKTKAPDGRLLSGEEIKEYRVALIDSLRMLREEIADLKQQNTSFHFQADSLLDSIQVLQTHKDRVKNEINQLQEEISLLNEQKEAVNIKEMDKLSTILKSLSADQLDSLYATLDDKTIMTIIDMAPTKKAISAVFEHVEPRRAAKLTSRYIHIRNQ